MPIRATKSMVQFKMHYRHLLQQQFLATYNSKSMLSHCELYYSTLGTLDYWTLYCISFIPRQATSTKHQHHFHGLDSTLRVSSPTTSCGSKSQQRAYAKAMEKTPQSAFTICLWNIYISIQLIYGENPVPGEQSYTSTVPAGQNLFDTHSQ